MAEKPSNTMRKTTISLLVVLIIGASLVIAGCVQNQPGVTASTPVKNDTLQQGNYTSNATLVAFVDEAVAYAKANGKEKALAEFNNPNGSFVRGELYIYAYDFNATTLAHPINPEKVGVNRWNETEGDVGPVLQNMSALARNGSFYYPLTYINPAHNRTLESKLAYGEKVDDTWWLGSGIYTGPVDQASGNRT
ncbi:putative cache sensor protein [Methanosphaerula palustris E1-9c]|uniref:Putative cache sensor protein n=2 Tax=Methanosphaerula palustris TaxID=475088 RepID=B8GI29_METPE|nr:putative cache sensor protein [Methanosphaerula palustris E1-9c]